MLIVVSPSVEVTVHTIAETPWLSLNVRYNPTSNKPIQRNYILLSIELILINKNALNKRLISLLSMSFYHALSFYSFLKHTVLSAHITKTHETMRINHL
ncbi:hypothetical protein B5G52_20755 [Pseudoalteromonas sp. A601]|nr:hypothetical protein B5G52_20755 [Pseudoalteromonas sp. A601]